MENVLFQTSLIAAFVAGMVALFAPCCITFLLPSYLGSVFKEKEKVLLMTLVFGLGIFVTLFPAVVGVSIVSNLLFRYHDSIYFLGGIVMLIVAFISLLGIKLPMPSLHGRKNPEKVDVVSVFTMGIFSGITSACCAPVLIGILTFAFLSPNFLGATLIGAVYVLGMITPLLIISLFLNGKMDKAMWIRKRVASMSLFGKTYVILWSNILAFVVFLTAGVFTLVFNAQGKLSMAKGEGFSKFIQNAGGYVGQYAGNNPLFNLAFFIIVILFIIFLLKRLK